MLDSIDLNPLQLLSGGLLEPLLFATAVAVALRLYVALSHSLSYTRRLLPLTRRVFRRRPIGYRAADVSVAYALIPPERIKLPYYMVEEGDVRCLYVVHSLLTELFGRDNVHATNERDLQAEVHDKRNLVILSGPVWNKTMELYLGLCGSPVKFSWDSDDLKLVGPDAEEYNTTYVGAHRVKQCHGLIVASRTRVTKVQQRVLIVAGCSNLSTYAGGMILSLLSHDKELKRHLSKSRVHRDKKWAVVFKVENWAEDPDSTLISPMQTGAVRVSIVATYREKRFSIPYEFHLGNKEGAERSGCADQ